MTKRRSDDCGSEKLLDGDHEAYGIHGDYDYEDGYCRRGDRASSLPDFPFGWGIGFTCIDGGLDVLAGVSGPLDSGILYPSI